jgi:hypothetical protein
MGVLAAVAVYPAGRRAVGLQGSGSVRVTHQLHGTEASGENPFAPSGQLGTQPPAYAEAALDASAQAWSALAGDAPVPAPLPQGPMTPAAAARAAALDAAIHAWDIAMATGQGSPLAPEPRSRRASPSRYASTEPAPRRSSLRPAPATPRSCSPTSAAAPTGRRDASVS